MDWIHTRVEELTNKTHCIVPIGKGDNAKLKICLDIDKIFLYFETRRLIKVENNQFKYIETVDLSPSSPSEIPNYDSVFYNQEENMVDFMRDIIARRRTKRKVQESKDIFEVNVSVDQYEATISSIIMMM